MLAGVVEVLFKQFEGYLARQGYIARGGLILDAFIVPVSKNRNTRDENKDIKAGEEPEGWADKSAKRAQKDTDARWTKKHCKEPLRLQKNVNVDRKHKLVRRYHVSDAALHDSQAVEHLLMRGNSGAGVWADPAYRSEEMGTKLHARGPKSRIHRKGKRGWPLNNRTKSTVCARVEHVYGAQTDDMGGTLMRTVGMARS